MLKTEKVVHVALEVNHEETRLPRFSTGEERSIEHGDRSKLERAREQSRLVHERAGHVVKGAVRGLRAPANAQQVLRNRSRGRSFRSARGQRARARRGAMHAGARVPAVAQRLQHCPRSGRPCFSEGANEGLSITCRNDRLANSRRASHEHASEGGWEEGLHEGLVEEGLLVDSRAEMAPL